MTAPFVIQFIDEKSKKIKETQKIMGLRSSAYIVGWIIYFQAITLIVSIFDAVALILMGLVSPAILEALNAPYQGWSGVGIWVLQFLIFGFASIHLMLFLTVFFNSPKLAAQIITLLFAFSGFLYFLLP